MKKITQLLLFTLLVINIINAKASASNLGAYSFNMYYVEWDGNSKAAAPEFMKLGSKKTIAGKEVIFSRIDGNQYPQKIKEFGIRGYPTVLLLDPSGKLVARYEGERKAEAMMAFLNQILQ